MIAELKRYPGYEEAGLPRIGQVPRHSEVVRIKIVLREIDCRSADGSGTLLSIQPNNYSQHAYRFGDLAAADFDLGDIGEGFAQVKCSRGSVRDS